MSNVKLNSEGWVRDTVFFFCIFVRKEKNFTTFDDFIESIPTKF